MNGGILTSQSSQESTASSTVEPTNRMTEQSMAMSQLVRERTSVMRSLRRSLVGRELGEQPPPHLPKRITHHDGLLEEVLSLSLDFRQERRWKLVYSKEISDDCADKVGVREEEEDKMEEEEEDQEKEEREEGKEALRSLATNLHNDIFYMWDIAEHQANASFGGEDEEDEEEEEERKEDLEEVLINRNLPILDYLLTLKQPSLPRNRSSLSSSLAGGTNGSNEDIGGGRNRRRDGVSEKSVKQSKTSSTTSTSSSSSSISHLTYASLSQAHAAILSEITLHFQGMNSSSSTNSSKNRKKRKREEVNKSIILDEDGEALDNQTLTNQLRMYLSSLLEVHYPSSSALLPMSCFCGNDVEEMIISYLDPECKIANLRNEEDTMMEEEEGEVDVEEDGSSISTPYKGNYFPSPCVLILAPLLSLVRWRFSLSGFHSALPILSHIPTSEILEPTFILLPLSAHLPDTLPDFYMILVDLREYELHSPPLIERDCLGEKETDDGTKNGYSFKLPNHIAKSISSCSAPRWVLLSSSHLQSSGSEITKTDSYSLPVLQSISEILYSPSLPSTTAIPKPSSGDLKALHQLIPPPLHILPSSFSDEEYSDLKARWIPLTSTQEMRYRILGEELIKNPEALSGKDPTLFCEAYRLLSRTIFEGSHKDEEGGGKIKALLDYIVQLSLRKRRGKLVIWLEEEEDAHLLSTLLYAFGVPHTNLSPDMSRGLATGGNSPQSSLSGGRESKRGSSMSSRSLAGRWDWVQNQIERFNTTIPIPLRLRILLIPSSLITHPHTLLPHKFEALIVSHLPYLQFISFLFIVFL